MTFEEVNHAIVISASLIATLCIYGIIENYLKYKKYKKNIENYQTKLREFETEYELALTRIDYSFNTEIYNGLKTVLKWYSSTLVLSLFTITLIIVNN